NQYNDSQSRNICHEMKAEKLRRFCPCLMSILQIEWQIIKRFSRTHQSLSIVKTVVCRQIIHLNPLRQMQSSCFEQPSKIITPRNRQSDISDGIFHNQRPADNPCDNFAKCDIRIRISTSGNRHHRGKLGIGKSRKTARQPGKHKQKNNRRTTICTRLPYRTENACSNNGGNTEKYQIFEG